ncbi:MAG: AarF/ABC1/UbiB kinase family protein [Actinomycetota bacterium]|nr:AarF/ABC1/UbiB kinase family protein [Actinomycetota bacterium]
MKSWRRKRRNIKRLCGIAQIVVKHGLGFYLERYRLKKFLPREKRRLKFEPPPREVFAKRLRMCLEELGPTFVKVGQLLSVRPDLVPPEVIFELEKLQDTVPPFDFDIVREQIFHEFGKELEELYLHFEPVPMAAASIAQVHRARLPDGREVVVKVQRPEAEKRIEADIDLLYYIARWVSRHVKSLEFLDLVGLVDELAASLRREIDFRVEGRHVDRFRFNFRDDPLLKVPLVIWPCSSKRILTMEYIEGTKISDLATPESLGIDTYDLAIHGAKAIMKQVLVDGFFHGDLHPANILITPDGKIAYLDFGIVGQIKEQDKETITRMLIAIIDKDVDEVVAQCQKLGVQISPNRINTMKPQFRDILDRYYGRKLGELKIDIIGREFLELIYENRIRIPKDYALLAKALITVEGVCKQLYPQINILEVAKPYAMELFKSYYPPERVLQDIWEEIKLYALIFRDYPKQLHDILKQTSEGRLEVISRDPASEDISRKMDIFARNVIISIFAAAIFIGSSLAYILPSKSGSSPSPLAIIGFVIAALMALWLFYFTSTRRSR